MCARASRARLEALSAVMNNDVPGSTCAPAPAPSRREDERINPLAYQRLFDDAVRVFASKACTDGPDSTTTSPRIRM